MIHKFTCVIALAIMVLAVGCTESPFDSNRDSAPPSPDLYSSLGKIGDAPDQSGLRVIRTSEGILILFSDFEAGLGVVVGENQDELCNGVFEGDEVDVQYILDVGNDDRLIRLDQGEVVATVWGLTQFTCYMIKNVDPLATGYVRWGRHDNDFFFSDEPNTNSWGFHANGKLNEGTTPFHLVRECHFDKDFKGQCKTKIGLQGYSAEAQNSTNGNFYRAFEAFTIPWGAAEASAENVPRFRNCSSHLATITSQQENDFIVSSFPEVVTGGYWIGGLQDPAGLEPAGGWGWVTSEPFSYTNWATGEPNDAGDEENIHFFPPFFGPQGAAGTWNDQNAFNTFLDGSLFPDGFDRGIFGFVVEYECG